MLVQLVGIPWTRLLQKFKRVLMAVHLSNRSDKLYVLEIERQSCLPRIFHCRDFRSHRSQQEVLGKSAIVTDCGTRLRHDRRP